MHFDHLRDKQCMMVDNCRMLEFNVCKGNMSVGILIVDKGWSRYRVQYNKEPAAPAWWYTKTRKVKKGDPLLVTKKYLCVPDTSASIEKLFYCYGLTISDTGQVWNLQLIFLRAVYVNCISWRLFDKQTGKIKIYSMRINNSVILCLVLYSQYRLHILINLTLYLYMDDSCLRPGPTGQAGPAFSPAYSPR
jgi:hypothetical protein